MKPIVPGCMVVIIEGWRAGQFGTAMYFLPAGSRVTVEQPVLRDLVLAKDGWAVDLHDDQKATGFDADAIMRIDGHEPTTADYELRALETSEG